MDQNRAAGANIYQAYNNGNAQLRQRYLSNLSRLLPHPIGRVPIDLQRYIALKLRMQSLFPESDWKEYVCLMGIEDDMQLAAIEASAECRKEMPMFIALNQFLADRSFAHLIYALLQLEHYSILQYLEPYTSRLLDISED